MRRRLRAWVIAKMDKWLRSRGLCIVALGPFTDARAWLLDAEIFCDTSGFLRDGRYPGGREAERKLRGKVGRAYDALTAALRGVHSNLSKGGQSWA